MKTEEIIKTFQQNQIKSTEAGIKKRRIDNKLINIIVVANQEVLKKVQNIPEFKGIKIETI